MPATRNTMPIADHRDALERAQRAGLEPEPVLQPERPAHQRRRRRGSRAGTPSRRGGSRMSASEVTPIVITRIRHDVMRERRSSRRRSCTSDSCASSTSATMRPAHGHGTVGITHHRCAFSSAWSRSQRISSSVSRPIDRRIISGVTPAARCSSSDSWRCVVDAGWMTSVFASPTLARCEGTARPR